VVPATGARSIPCTAGPAPPVHDGANANRPLEPGTAGVVSESDRNVNVARCGPSHFTLTSSRNGMTRRAHANRLGVWTRLPRRWPVLAAFVAIVTGDALVYAFIRSTDVSSTSANPRSALRTSFTLEPNGNVAGPATMCYGAIAG